jgi:hypothetical protein
MALSCLVHDLDVGSIFRARLGLGLGLGVPGFRSERSVGSSEEPTASVTE